MVHQNRGLQASQIQINKLNIVRKCDFLTKMIL